MKKAFLLLYELASYPCSAKGVAACFQEFPTLAICMRARLFLYQYLLVCYFLLFIFCNEFAAESSPKIRHYRSKWNWNRPVSVEPTAGYPNLRLFTAGSPQRSSTKSRAATSVQSPALPGGTALRPAARGHRGVQRSETPWPSLLSPRHH